MADDSPDNVLCSEGSDITEINSADCPSFAIYPLPSLDKLPTQKKSQIWRSPSSPTLKTEFDVNDPAASPGALLRSRTLSGGAGKSLIHGELALEADFLSQLRRWVLALVVVEFDLDLGPEIRGVHPPLPLTSADARNIAFSSFPDSLQFDQGAQTHSFRLQVSLQEAAKPYIPPPFSIASDGFLHGFAYFSQRRDVKSTRGYQQRSLVVLTHLQYPSLFSSVMSTVGPPFEVHGEPILETVCHNIATWSDPMPGKTVELPLLGTILQAELPHTVDSQQLTETSSFREIYDPERHIIALSAPLSPAPLALFEASLTHLWSLWECLILCEPLLVFGSSPALTSQAVWWLRDLQRPIPQSGDIRPYFTIHDKDHLILVNKMPPKSGLVLGVTNPLFDKLCKHWPHVLSLGRPLAGSATAKPSAGPAPGWKSKTHRRYISKDRQLLAKLEQACREGEESRMEASLVLRRHFCSRTTAFLVPLHRYLNTLIPTPAEFAGADPSKVFPLKPFSTANFFASLKSHGSPLPFRSIGKQKEFYERWLKTPAFGVWLGRQEEVVRKVLQDNNHHP